MIQVRDPQIGERIHDVQSDFNCVIVIRGREAYRVERFMRLIDQREKPLVVCATHAHAAMVRDLINQARTRTDPLYCVRVTANDGALGGQHLLRLKYNAIADATADLGTPDQIRQTFIGFQKYLYVQIDQS